MNPAMISLLLAAGVASQILCSLGLLLSRTVYARLHFVSAASLCSLLIAAAVWLEEGGVTPLALKALLIFAVLAVSGPILVHAAARAVYIREGRNRETRP